LLGPTRAHILAIALIGRLHSLGYSRDAESKADVTGSRFLLGTRGCCQRVGAGSNIFRGIARSSYIATIVRIPPCAMRRRHARSALYRTPRLRP
jgi:hypothetical protein